MVFSATALAVALARQASAGVPPSLIETTIQAVAGVVSPAVAEIAKGVVQGMFLTKMTTVAAMILVIGVTGLGAGTLAHRALADRPADGVAAVHEDRPEAADDKKEKEAGARKGQKEKEKDRGPRGKNAGENATLTGTVEKRVAQRKRDDGTSTNVTLYYLVEEGGNKVQLPAPRRKEDGTLLDKFELENYVGKKVSLTGRTVFVRTSEKPNAARRAVRMLTITELFPKK
jgi:hypothetical protein